MPRGGARPGAGPKFKLDATQAAEVRRRCAAGETHEAVAAALGVHQSTVTRYVHSTAP